MHETFKKGQLAVLKVQERALEKDITICFPTVESRYDAVLVDNKTGLCQKAQIKFAGYHANNASDSILLDLRKETRNNKNKKTYNEHEIDILLVFIPDVNKVLYFSKEIFSNKKSINIRLSLPKNGQKNGILMYEDFVW